MQEVHIKLIKNSRNLSMSSHHSLADLEREAGLRMNRPEKQRLIPKFPLSVSDVTRREQVYDDVGDEGRSSAQARTSWSHERVVVAVLGCVVTLFGLGIIVAFIQQQY